MPSEPDIILYWGSGSPYAWRALLTLELKRVPFVSRLLEFSKGDHRKPEFLALNPRHKVPVLVDGDVIVHESLAILAYLDRRFPEPALLGTDPASTGAIWQAVFEAVHYLDAPTTKITRALFSGKGEADVVREAVAEVERELDGFEAGLSHGPWLGGRDRVSAIDLVVYPAVRGLQRAATKPTAADFGFAFDLQDRWPRVFAWRERFMALPGVADTEPPHWR